MHCPTEAMGHERLSKHEGTHLRVRLIMEQVVQRTSQRLFLAAIFLIAVPVQRQTRHRFLQDVDAGIHSGYLHGGTLVDVLAGGGASKEKAVLAAGCPILGLVTGLKQAGRESYRLDLTSFLFLDIQILDRARGRVYSLNSLSGYPLKRRR